MAFVNLYFNVIIFVSIVLVNSAAQNFSNCSNDSVSCSSQFIHPDAPEDACQVVPVIGSGCADWKFNVNSFPLQLGSVTLKMYHTYKIASFNVTASDIKWTRLRFRFHSNAANKSFCREFKVSSEYNLSELFYDCLWTDPKYEGQYFTFEYEATTLSITESRRYIFYHPSYEQIVDEKQVPLLYVDVSESPFLTARWQQVPQKLGVKKYKVQFFSSVDDSEPDLKKSDEIEGNSENSELSYKLDFFPSSGKYYFSVSVISNISTDLPVKSPDILINDVVGKTVIVGIVGCVVLIPVFLLILYMWKRQCRPPSGDTKRPKVLIIYTPSRASHVNAIIKLTEYLRNHCFVHAMLDQLDIPDSDTQDPFAWCNEAFSTADYIMVVSSPSKCCQQEGIFRNVDIVALQFLKERFSNRNSKPQYFAVLLPYCTENDIPSEAKNIRTFKLLKDWDKMLWHIHNDGRYPSVVDSARSLLGPKISGGKSDLNIKGMMFLSALKEAEHEVVRVCNCKNLTAVDNIESENENEHLKPTSDNENMEKFSGRKRNISDTNSMDGLVENSVPYHVDTKPDDVALLQKDIDFELPVSIDDLDLSGTGLTYEDPNRGRNNTEDFVMDLNSMKL